MLSRCNNSRNKAFPIYGGRGIAVCSAWRDFRTFADWAVTAGYGPGLVLDRINNDCGYCPENCRWVDRTESTRNRRSNKLSHTLAALVRFAVAARVSKPIIARSIRCHLRTIDNVVRGTTWYTTPDPARQEAPHV
jgi:hypothetical protein